MLLLEEHNKIYAKTELLVLRCRRRRAVLAYNTSHIIGWVSFDSSLLRNMRNFPTEARAHDHFVSNREMLLI